MALERVIHTQQAHIYPAELCSELPVNRRKQRVCVLLFFQTDVSRFAGQVGVGDAIEFASLRVR